MNRVAVVVLSSLAVLLGAVVGWRVVLAVLGVSAGVFGGLLAPWWALWRWRGAWRLAAGVLVALIVFTAPRIVLGVRADPTSHNLWPFELLILGVFNAAALLGMALLRRITGVGDPS